MLRSEFPNRTAVLVIGLLAVGASHALELEDCRISAGPAFPGIKARCGTMLRPENPADPGSPEIEIGRICWIGPSIATRMSASRPTQPMARAVSL